MTVLPLNPYKWFESLPPTIANLYTGKFKNPGISPIDKTLYELLVKNFILWGYEDEARRTDIPDMDIANLKRNIDKENQNRNNLIDTIDALLVQDIEKNIKSDDKALPLNSENPGSIFDRLTILALRIHHLKKETDRKDINKSHIERCTHMLKEVQERSGDLLSCLGKLLEDYYSGRRRLKSYKQHKLYNDPELNPSLRQKK